MQDRHEMVPDAVTGQGEGWSVPFVVKLQIASCMPIAKGIVGAAQDNDRVSYFNSALFCHDAGAPFT